MSQGTVGVEQLVAKLKDTAMASETNNGDNISVLLYEL